VQFTQRLLDTLVTIPPVKTRRRREWNNEFTLGVEIWTSEQVHYLPLALPNGLPESIRQTVGRFHCQFPLWQRDESEALLLKGRK